MKENVKKPLIAVTLSASLMFGTVVSVGAEMRSPTEPVTDKQQLLRIQEEVSASTEPEAGAMQREEALKKARELVNVPSDYTLESSQYYSADRWRPYGTWNFEFVKKENNHWQGSLSISINAVTGELTSYYTYNNDQSSYPPKVSREEAQHIATEFLSRFAADRMSEVELDPFGLDQALPIMDPSERYHFEFIRTHKGIPYPDNYLSVSVNTNGDVVHFHSNWHHHVTFPEVGESLIPLDEALALYREVGEDQLKLRYVSPWSKYQEYDIAYFWDTTFKDSVAHIDAETGQALNGNLEEIGDATFKPEPVSSSQLHPHFRNRTSDLTEKEALDHVVRLLRINLNQFEVGSSSYYSNEQYNRNEWNFSFRAKQPEDGNQHWISVSVDTRSGMIYHYYNENYRLLSQPIGDRQTLSEQAIVNRAIEAVKRFTPEIAHQIYYTGNYNDNEGSRTAYVNFVHMINGVYVSDYPFYISVDKVTGDITNFSTYSSRISNYPQPTNLVSKEAALDKLFEDSKVTLQYQSSYHYDATQDEIETKVVYSLRLPTARESLYLNAQTGQWHSMETGEPFNLHRIAPQDIEGHWAEEALMLMYQYRALDTDEEGNILPDQTMTRGEMIKMIVLALNRGRFYSSYGLERAASFADVRHGSALFNYVEAAVDMNLLERNDQNLNPNEKLTREEIAAIVVRALGYENLAKRNDLFQLSVSDRDQIKSKGHVAIVLNLGIMSAQNGAFEPGKEVSRAEAAIVFQRFLERRTELSDSPRAYFY